MIKKIASLLLVISILATVCIPAAFAAGEVTKIDPIITTKIPIGSYSDYNTGSEYMQIIAHLASTIGLTMKSVCQRVWTMKL